jgi:ribosomal protein L14E/L6E/L27E
MDREREELINSIKNNMPDEKQLEIVEKMAEDLKGKSEEEILAEIKKLNKEMESKLSPEKYKEILGKLDKIRPILSKTQKKKLDMLLEILNNDK